VREFVDVLISQFVRNRKRWLVVLLSLSAIGCRQQMDKQPKYLPLEKSGFFADGRASRPLVEGTVARGHLEAGVLLYTGLRQPADDDSPTSKPTGIAPPPSVPTTPITRPFNPDDMALYVDQLPLPVTAELLDRGQQRYMIFCAVCHDAHGTGRGVVVRRGFSPPPSYDVERLRNVPVGYIFEIVTHGYGSMPSHAQQIPPRDRWAIAAYVKALQLSQFVPLDDLPAADQQLVRANLTPAAGK